MVNRLLKQIKGSLKMMIKKTPFYNPMLKLLIRLEVIKWERKGRPIPPPHIIKQKVLKSYSKKYDLRVLVETGTYYGDMVETMKTSFDQVYSIELSEDLYKMAVQRFANVKNVELLQGDSGVELKKLLKKINQPALFWLDAHYSGGVTAKGNTDTPIIEELSLILKDNENTHVIIIDDARCFGSDPAYPSLEELKDKVKAMNSNVNIRVQDDMIRIIPHN